MLQDASLLAISNHLQDDHACAMQQVGIMSEDAAVLLAIKDAEVQSLRQQMAQLTIDLKRNLEVHSLGHCCSKTSCNQACRTCRPF